MAARASDRLLLGASLLLAVTSGAVFALLARRPLPAAGPPLAIEFAREPYASTAPTALPVRTNAWLAPVAQSRGREWIYDAFTPPEIFYNPRSKQFTVKPPFSLREDEVVEDFGLELIAVHPEPFRLQVIGYVGGEGSWRGVFQNRVSGEVFLASGNHPVPALALTIRSLDVSLHAVRRDESMTSRQRVATAIVHDERTGRDITLTHRERVFTETLFAFVAAPGDTATREVRTGDVFKQGDATYRIENIKSEPPSIEAVKEAPTLRQPDRRVLIPRDADVEASVDPSSL